VEKNAIELSKLRKEYGSLVAVRDAELKIEKGSVVALVGPNGAGKTTLLKMLATLLPPTSGTAVIGGLDIVRDYMKVRGRVGYLPDFFGLYNDLTLRECLNFFAQCYKVAEEKIPAQIENVLEMVDLCDKADSLITELSRGMVQRIGLACLLVWQPDVYLLDEPASGLDPKARIILRNILREQSSAGKTVIISSHILTELSGFCSHVVFMDKGSIIEAGTVDQISRKQGRKFQAMITILENGNEACKLIDSAEIARVSNISGNNILIEYDGNDSTLASINQKLVTSGYGVATIAARKVELEELFMEISK
jgi:ABC-2 type transport system ATP-binding protein